MLKKLLFFAMILSLAGFTVNCSDFLKGGILDSDPNRPDEVPLLSQLVALQPIGYGFYTADIGIFASVWMQQMAGTAHQYSDYEVYGVDNTDFSMFNQMYQEGGLIDIKLIKAQAEEEGNMTVLGMTKMYEALIFATGADVFGDIPYSEAASVEFEHPHYDEQLSVHNACITLLDEAIAHLQAAEAADEFFDESFDFSFGGDRNMMIAAARTLKARILLNWAKVNSGNYAQALAAAQNGISSVAGNWMAPFRDVVNEQNVYYQFNTIRGDNIKASRFFVELMRGTNDPRLDFYFAAYPDSGRVVGSPHAASNGSTSWFNPASFGDPGWDLDMVSYEENQFIIAECQYHTGGDALATLNGVLGDIENRYGFAAESIQRYAGISGADLLEAIMMEKYKALFLNPQVWNDWKRTGYPAIVSNIDDAIPRRFMYPDDEQNTNENFPGVRGIWARNDNDPN